MSDERDKRIAQLEAEVRELRELLKWHPVESGLIVADDVGAILVYENGTMVEQWRENEPVVRLPKNVRLWRREDD